MSHRYHLSPEADEVVRAWIRRHKRGLRWALLVAVFPVFVLAILAAWALFQGAGHVKHWLAGQKSLRIPLQWEQPLGEAALAQMRGQVRFITDPKVLDPLRRLAAPLFYGRTNSSDRFTLFLADSREINACALPGGFIIVNRGLVERARTPEEIQGVLAHEMAHVTQRHGVLQLAQGLGMDLVLQQLQGNESAVPDKLIRDSARLLGLKFSRDHERAADDLGWELLQQAQVNPQGMVDFFAAMKAEMDAKGPDAFVLGANLLSTHPTPLERIKRLREKQSRGANREYKSFADDFAVLQTGLGLRLENP